MQLPGWCGGGEVHVLTLYQCTLEKSLLTFGLIQHGKEKNYLRSGLKRTVLQTETGKHSM